MVTELQIRRNRENAKHSTGPRTVEGKNRVRMNAVKHGMTAQVVMLPGERAAEFNRQVIMWFEQFRPQNEFEVRLAQDLAYCSWQADRCRRAGTAQAYVSAVTGDLDEERKRQREAIEYSQILFRPPFGRPTLCPRGELPDAGSGKAWTDEFDPNQHPKLVLIGLEANPFGVDWLLQEWNSLELPLQQRESWGASERFRALRLLGYHATDACLTYQLRSILHACQVLDPGAGSLVAEVWGDVISANHLPQIEVQYAQFLSREPELDADSARERLLAIARGEITRLEERAQEHRERAELLAALGPNLEAFDTSPEGQRALRYEFSWRRLRTGT